MKKGVILSVNKRFVTLLTPEGEFLKTKRGERSYEVGEEITFSPVKQKTAFTIFSFHSTFKKTAVLSIVSTFLILFSVMPSYFTGHVSAYMTIDVNPSIELELNDHLEVLKLTGLNEDGKLVIGQLKDWKGEGIKTVTNRIVETTKQLGYLKGKKQIVVSTTLLDKDKNLDKNLKEEIKKISEQENGSKTKMKVIQATKSDREQAKVQGISTGKYVEKKLKKNHDKVKVNKREPEQEKTEEEKNGTSEKQSEIQGKESETDQENIKGTSSNVRKQPPLKEAKPQAPEKLETLPDEKQVKPNREDHNGKRMEINRLKEKSKQPKGKPGSSRSIRNKQSVQSNRNSQSHERNENNHYNPSTHSKQSGRDNGRNYTRDKQKNERPDNRFDKNRYSADKDERSEREKVKNDHLKSEKKKDEPEREKGQKGKGTHGSGRGHNN
ncbi:anti-sigma factor domain-containing protein [Peribacillus muralis]|uniref:anti-sigma-I factor RsgI family protein n=1 Tax=Peribacillus muralis TaxID=264697 RepID=UPI000710B5F0|nr:anti-sigma factor domain-containing protein [Peribacillus muralis]